MPKECPFCHAALHKPEGEVVWRCANTSCPAKIRRGLEHFASRRAMNIEGLGESLVDQLVTTGMVHDFADLYRLDRDALANLTGVSMREGRELKRRLGDKSASKLVDRDRGQQEERLLAADLRRGDPSRGRAGRAGDRPCLREPGRAAGGARRIARARERHRPGRCKVSARLSG